MKQINFSQTNSSDLQKFDTLILPVFSDGIDDKLIRSFIKKKTLRKVISSGDFSGKSGESLMLLDSDKVKRVIFIGLGEKDKLTEKTYISAVKACNNLLKKTGATLVLNALSAIKFKTPDWLAYQNTLEAQKSFYDYVHPSRGKHTPKTTKLDSMTFFSKNAKTSANKNIIKQAQASAQGMALTQDLANMPSNFCTPSYLAETALELGNTYGFTVKILERDEMIKMGMGAFMSVAQGGPTPPKMICLSYKGGKKSDAPIALVGKGVTFDTGGISLKPGASMDEMKYDMGGAATVLGAFKALGELKPNLNVVGVIPATENMPSGEAIKPGDVVTSLSGQTIEILNTDAEGRMLLCDALTYTQQTYQPAKIIDMATLTGACIVALGHEISAVLGNNQELINDILQAGQTTYDRFWQLPLSAEYDEQLKSNFADMANIGGRAGTITAAQFLARFTKNTPWAHLDIAGTAWTSGKNKGATGRPVPALVEYLIQQSLVT